MTETRIDLSVVVAAYNEAAVIAANLARITAELETRPQVRWELICVDDGSQDETGGLLDEFAAGDARVRVIHLRRNFGQGRALRAAFDVCRGEVVVTLDSDLSYGPEYVYRLLDALDQAPVDIALASPYAKGGTVRNVPAYRRLLSRWGNRYLARMSSYKISTVTSVVRAYRAEVLDELVLTADGSEIQVEVLMKAAMLGFRVVEVPADLVWSPAKSAGGRRVSKLGVRRAIRTYLRLGWLSRPAYFFFLLSTVFILPGLYMAGWIVYRVVAATIEHLNLGFLAAVSQALSDVYEAHTYDFIISGGLLLFGFMMMGFALLVIQNRFYYEEMYKLNRQVRRQGWDPGSRHGDGPSANEDDD
ncbi:MAG: glycosyltransferase family 2 protein [Proteobacteria bacterium]|nr:glycosyltransferase family 2 protein [Pseudomonadota bacterium]